jgi:glycosyltransferase involved in cell wall biosynthesis
MTNDPAQRVAAVLAPLRDVADEIVVAVDSRVDQDLLGGYEEHADTLVRFPYLAPMERSLGWLHAQASGRWIFRVDGDEVVAPETAAALRELCEQDDVNAHWFARRWLWPDAHHWIDELPWSPDFQLRLVRNEPSTLWFPGLVHSGPANVMPARWHDLPMYHLDCVLKDAATRRRKGAEYDAIRPGLLAPGGLVRTNDMYDPEQRASLPPVPVPEAHRAAIERALNLGSAPARHPATKPVTLATRADIDAFYAARHDERDVPSLRRGSVTILDSDLRFTAGQPRPLTVRVSNGSEETWAGGLADRPRVRVSSRWVRLGDLSDVIDGPRELLGAPLHAGASTVVPLPIQPPLEPGPWTLDVDLLHEYVGWFDVGASITVELLPPPTEHVAQAPVPPKADEGDDLPFVAAVLATGAPERWLSTLESLRRAEPTVRIVLGTTDPQASDLLVMQGDQVIATDDAGVLVEAAHAERAHVLLVVDPVLVPLAFLARARESLRATLRTGTVSFWSNAAGFLSFPNRNSPRGHQLLGNDVDGVTALLRGTPPAGADVPIPFATGAAVVLSHWMLSATEPLTPVEGFRPEVALADLSLRARQRGFLDVLDPTTFVTRLDDIGDHGPQWAVDAGRSWLESRHPWLPMVLEDEVRVPHSPLGISHTTARVKSTGLRVLIDGRCLGPLEMGTQVQTLAVIDALASRPDVREVCVALPGPAPGYAAPVLGRAEVNAAWTASADITDVFGPVDVLHRPYQPDGRLEVEHWRGNAARVVLTVQDLIAYGIGAYHQSDVLWMQYRMAMRQAVSSVDGVVVISHDVRNHFDREQLPVDPGRLFVTENGTDHLTGGERGRPPRELVALERTGSRFALCIGADYAHKNRDLAIQAVQQLAHRDEGLVLVLVGAGVPRGSSRRSEALLHARTDPNVITLPDVDGDERNWLLRHASVVLYPSGAEGFGLVPFEAARFGTPTVLVPSGAIGEVVGELPVASRDWDPASLAEALVALTRDPDLAAQQLSATLRAGTRYTWERTAGRLVDVYRALLATAPR